MYPNYCKKLHKASQTYRKCSFWVILIFVCRNVQTVSGQPVWCCDYSIADKQLNVFTIQSQKDCMNMNSSTSHVQQVLLCITQMCCNDTKNLCIFIILQLTHGFTDSPYTHTHTHTHIHIQIHTHTRARSHKHLRQYPDRQSLKLKLGNDSIRSVVSVRVTCFIRQLQCVCVCVWGRGRTLLPAWVVIVHWAALLST